ncbi:MAG: hypothetical protein MUO77_14050, partial [Anaerolineales bacterium]|nr:hypothetical protein [Anaerolineales bacterium]
MQIPKKLFLVLITLVLVIFACDFSTASPQVNPADPFAFNTMVASTSQAMLAQTAAANPPTQAAPSPPTQPAPQPPTSTLTDEAAIKLALLAKFGWNEADMEFSIGQNNGQIAKGSLKNVNEINGAAWFAAKD